MALVADYGMSSDDDDLDDDGGGGGTRHGHSGMDNNTTAMAAAHTVSKSNQDSLLSNELHVEKFDEVLEDFVKKTNYGEAPIEKPPPKPTKLQALSKIRIPNANKGKIQISIPTLQESDSDDDEPKVKRTKSSVGAAGFLGSLPAPRSSGGGKEAGRAFIPYTLTKSKPAETKPAVTKARVQRTKPITAAKLAEAYSDSDDEMPAETSDTNTSANFFSLTSEPNSSRVDMQVGVNATPSLIDNVASANFVEEKPKPRITAASLYNMTDQVEYDTGQADNYMEHEESNSQVDDLLQNEQFLRLQGKKQRGKEAIDIIDVHTDDQKASELELTKNLTEEVDPSAFAHRKKGEGPSGQQKRKHQITYLAFQAKERELELKNTWSANKATKQKTQARYGF